MSDRRIGALLSLVRQGLSLEVEFGHRSLGALVRLAEVVEESVYRPASFVRTPSGFQFILDNPPLRIGAFGSVRLFVDGTVLPPGDVRYRTEEGRPWRKASEVTSTSPLILRAGEPVTFAGDRPLAAGSHARLVRLELRSVAIPPLVWLEFRDTPRELPGGV